MLLTKSLLSLAAFATVVLGATVQDVLNDLATVRTRVTTLDNAIKAFPNPGGTLTQALAIHTDATSVQSAVDTTTSDANALPGPVSEADGRSILNAVEAIQPTIKDALTQIVAKKPAFDALPIGGIPALIKQDLSNLQASTAALENALIAKAPADLVPEANTVKNDINSSFNTAIAAYA